MKQDESHSCLNTNTYKVVLWSLAGEGGCNEEGAKRDKISNKNHPKKHQHMSYNPYLKK